MGLPLIGVYVAINVFKLVKIISGTTCISNFNLFYKIKC